MDDRSEQISEETELDWLRYPRTLNLEEEEE